MIRFSRRLAQEIDALRPEFQQVTHAVSALHARRAQFAPTFMAVYHRWQRATGRTFVAFVHELDPSVPADRKEYPHHHAYQAALYLRRLVDAPETAAGRQRTTMTPYQLLVRALRSLLVLAGLQADTVWITIAKTSGWTEVNLAKLHTHVSKAPALIVQPTTPRLVKRRLPTGKLTMAKVAAPRAITTRIEKVG